MSTYLFGDQGYESLEQREDASDTGITKFDLFAFSVDLFDVNH